MPRVSVPLVAFLVLAGCLPDGGIYDKLDPRVPLDPSYDDVVTYGECRSQGYWKTHGDLWPVEALYVGGESYDADELLEVMHTAPGGNASLILAVQLIAAKLNHAMYGNVHGVVDVIGYADELLEGRGRLRSFTVSSTDELGLKMLDIAERLEGFNTTEGCGDPTGGSGGSGGSGGWDPVPLPYPYTADVIGTCEGLDGCDRVELVITLTDTASPANDLFVHRLSLHASGAWGIGDIVDVWSDGQQASWTGQLTNHDALDVEITAVGVADTHAPLRVRVKMTSHALQEDLDQIQVTLQGTSAPLDQAHDVIDHQQAVRPY